MDEENFHDKLKRLMDEYAHMVYRVTKTFPRDELFGVISQLRRASLSVVLNYVEGFARCKDKVHENFLTISYGSLKESRYLIDFSLQEKYLSSVDHRRLIELADRIGAMLWGMIKKM